MRIEVITRSATAFLFALSLYGALALPTPQEGAVADELSGAVTGGIEGAADAGNAASEAKAGLDSGFGTSNSDAAAVPNVPSQGVAADTPPPPPPPASGGDAADAADTSSDTSTALCSRSPGICGSKGGAASDEEVNPPVAPDAPVPPTYDEISDALSHELLNDQANLANGETMTIVWYTEYDDGVAGAVDWAKQHIGTGKFWTYNEASSAVSASGLTSRTDPDDIDQLRTMQEYTMRAMGKIATGEVDVLIPAGETPLDDSALYRWEFSALQHENTNPGVIVYRVDPTTSSKSVWWKFGDPPFLPAPE